MCCVALMDSAQFPFSLSALGTKAKFHIYEKLTVDTSLVTSAASVLTWWIPSEAEWHPCHVMLCTSVMCRSSKGTIFFFSPHTGKEDVLVVSWDICFLLSLSWSHYIAEYTMFCKCNYGCNSRVSERSYQCTWRHGKKGFLGIDKTSEKLRHKSNVILHWLSFPGKNYNGGDDGSHWGPQVTDTGTQGRNVK